MLTYLVFDSLEQAETANNIISQNKKYQDGITLKWAEIITADDNKFALLKPEEIYMNNITDYTESTFEPVEP